MSKRSTLMGALIPAWAYLGAQAADLTPPLSVRLLAVSPVLLPSRTQHYVLLVTNAFGEARSFWLKGASGLAQKRPIRLPGPECFLLGKATFLPIGRTGRAPNATSSLLGNEMSEVDAFMFWLQDWEGPAADPRRKNKVEAAFRLVNRPPHIIDFREQYPAGVPGVLGDSIVRELRKRFPAAGWQEPGSSSKGGGDGTKRT